MRKLPRRSQPLREESTRYIQGMQIALNGTFETDDGLHLEPVVDQKTGMYYQIVQDSD